MYNFKTLLLPIAFILQLLFLGSASAQGYNPGYQYGQEYGYSQGYGYQKPSVSWDVFLLYLVQGFIWLFGIILFILIISSCVAISMGLAKYFTMCLTCLGDKKRERDNSACF